jgi:hypothetical protein
MITKWYNVLPKASKNKKFKIHAFIFNWPKHTHKALKLEKQIKSYVDKVTVINSATNYKKSSWVNLDEDAYFTAQFCKAAQLFDGDIMFHIQADASIKDMKNLILAAKDVYSRYSCGIYAPNVDYTRLTGDKVDFTNIAFTQDIDLRYVTMTDCTCWFLSKSLIQEFKRNYLKLFYKTTKYGWGIIKLMSIISLYKRKLTIRDYSFKVNHPRTTNYNIKISDEQAKDFFSKLQAKLICLEYKNSKTILKCLKAFKNYDKETITNLLLKNKVIKQLI